MTECPDLPTNEDMTDAVELAWIRWRVDVEGFPLDEARREFRDWLAVMSS